VSSADSLTETLGELPKESHVGAAMSEITNRRYLLSFHFS
jgi:hypothetical protein